MQFSSRAYDTSFHEGYSLEHYLSPSVATAEGQRSGKPVRFLLVEGPPGIGKSTFAWELCRRWDEIENLRDYHTVVLLKLREKWVLNATSLSDLFRYPSNPNFSKNIAEELVATQGKHLLLVLDGFDEVSHSFHEDSVIKSILCKQLLPECAIYLACLAKAVDDNTGQKSYNPLSQLGAIQKLITIQATTADGHSLLTENIEANTMRTSISYPLLDVEGTSIVGSKGNGWVIGSLAGVNSVDWT